MAYGKRDAEQLRADAVIGKIKKDLAGLMSEAGQSGAEIRTIRRNFWEDVTVNIEDAHEAAETEASIKQQAELLSERERRHLLTREKIGQLKRLETSPYFGRIDFREEGENGAEQIYIGPASFYDEASGQFLVYDWRAPVSSVYYDYTLGEASFRAPEGIIKGNLELKRQFVIRQGKIESMFDTGVTIGDEMLQEVLGQSSGTSMKSIISTIQQEQNRIIRDTDSRLLIVQGAAGSGKTSAALQRVAFLLYHFRDSLDSDQILLFSPNTLFNRYVAEVLPELGENNMQQTTFFQYLDERLGDVYELETPFEQIEEMLNGENQHFSVRLKGIRHKTSEVYLHEIDRFIEQLGFSGAVFKDISFRGQLIMTAEQISEHFYSQQNHLPFSERLNLTAGYIKKQLKKREKEERKKQWAEEAIQYLSKEEYFESYRRAERLEEFNRDAREEEILAAGLVRKKFNSLYRQIARYAFLDIVALYRAAAEFSSLDSETAALTLQEMDRGRLFYEDAAPLLYLKEQLEGFKVNLMVRYVFIDEAQDYSAFQFSFIKRLFPRSKLTVLGDFNQKIFPLGSDGLKMLQELYADGKVKKAVLNKSYRSTYEIVEFTKALLDGETAIEPFNRHGEKPVLRLADPEDIPSCLCENAFSLQEKGHGNIAVICKTAEDCRGLAEQLKGKLAFSSAEPGQTVFHKGIVIIPSYLAKGIEFDAVIILGGTYTETERKLFYTACTRAMHELVILSGEMPGLMSGVPEELYERKSYKKHS